jgi:hypothetical protein
MFRSYDNHGEFLTVPKDVMAIIFNLASQETDGWKTLMSILMVNNTFYQMYFKDLAFAQRLRTHVNFINAADKNGIYNFASLRHILRVNYMQSSRKYKQISDAMDKCNVPTNSPGTLSNLQLITETRDLINYTMKLGQHETDLYGLKRAGLGLILLLAGALLARTLYQHDHLSPIGLLFMVVVAAITGKFGYEDVMIRTEDNHHASTAYQQQMNELNHCIAFMNSHQPGKLFGKFTFFDTQNVVSLPNITSTESYNMMLRINRILDNPAILRQERAEAAAALEAEKLARIAAPPIRAAQQNNDLGGFGAGLFLFGALALGGIALYAATRDAPANDDRDEQDEQNERRYNYRGFN